MADSSFETRRRAIGTSGHRGFTLVELLVVIAIIGILVALLLPAIQAAREAARRSSCVNNLRNVGLGVLEHVDAFGYFPSNGWGTGWTADPDQGSGKNQPGSWMFSILPFIEESSVHDIGRGSPGWPVPAKKKIELAKIIQTPIQLFYCPTRRRAQAYPVKIWTGKNWTHDGSPLARNDYAANVGSGSTIAGLVGAYTPNTYLDAPTWNWPDQKLYDGISFIRSEVSLRQVADGTSKTYMAGEKALNADAYEANDGVTIIDHGDDQGYLVGHNGDTVRSSGFPIIQDIRGGNPYESFGSAHPGGMNMMFADGSVRTINFEIDLTAHKGMGTRAGAETATEN